MSKHESFQDMSFMPFSNNGFTPAILLMKIYIILSHMIIIVMTMIISENSFNPTPNANSTPKFNNKITNLFQKTKTLCALIVIANEALINLLS